jgi:hypothetical protein
MEPEASNEIKFNGKYSGKPNLSERERERESIEY